MPNPSIKLSEEAPLSFCESDVRRFFRLLQQGDSKAVIELRALAYGGRENNTYAGFFDTEDSFVDAAKQATQLSGGVYVTINVCNPQLLCRAANRAKPYAKLTTSDRDILRRRYLPIDLDPERPAGTASSDEQHQAAIVKGDVVQDFIAEKGWLSPIVVDSGNGCHLFMPFEQANDDDAKLLAMNILKGLSNKFSDTEVKVDTSVFNAARIMRLPGTMNRKGDHLPKYPHRLCRILKIPETLQPTAEDPLQPEEVA